MGPPLTPPQATAALDSFETDDMGWHGPPCVGPELDFELVGAHGGGPAAARPGEPAVAPEGGPDGGVVAARGVVLGEGVGALLYSCSRFWSRGKEGVATVCLRFSKTRVSSLAICPITPLGNVIVHVRKAGGGFWLD